MNGQVRMTDEELFTIRWSYIWAILDFMDSVLVSTHDKEWNQMYEWAGGK